MNLCNQGHDDIAYDGGKACPLCQLRWKMEELRKEIPLAWKEGFKVRGWSEGNDPDLSWAWSDSRAKQMSEARE